ncbi:hypothetical protein FQN50_005775 [Emmonsiellopsis sp. PD_5]|nr:hypothetical protein FQN50_005775 [Emmonsiellopsis sp. PD_5]
MAKPRLPLTPASSTDITAKEKPTNSPVELFFSLPPAALPNSANGSTTAPSPRSSSRAHHASASPPKPVPPMSPISPDVPPVEAHPAPRSSRQRSGTNKRSAAADITLPPPPTRTRKIIQMKPKTQAEGARSGGTAESKSNAENGNGGATLKKKKQDAKAGSTAAGRKIARKTAHSLIERRRRSKMNEEFSTLKNMIPACRGQEMHKLAILQAAIDYMNYLEQCITELRSADNRTEDSSEHSVSPAPAPAPSRKRSHSRTQDESRHQSFSPSPSGIPTPSPNIPPISNTHEYEYEYTYQSPPLPSSSSTSSAIAPSASLLPSPAINPSSHMSPPLSSLDQQGQSQQRQSIDHAQYAFLPPPASSVGLSPVILSQRGMTEEVGLGRDVDREASAALLMLNIERRGGGGVGVAVSRGAGGDGYGYGYDSGSVTNSEGREGEEKRKKLGMSVQDLLSH